jgi:hypothetical protein
MGYSSGHISNVEGGFVTPSRELVDTYLALGADRRPVDRLMGRITTLSDERRSARCAHCATVSQSTCVGSGCSSFDLDGSIGLDVGRAKSARGTLPAVEVRVPRSRAC